MTRPYPDVPLAGTVFKNMRWSKYFIQIMIHVLEAWLPVSLMFRDPRSPFL